MRIIHFMQRNQKSNTVIISYCFILLFLYAAVSKLLDFETFTVQLAQSPLLSAYAGVISWAVPGIEILIACLLIFERFRILALYASFTLMVMFTAYIFIILNFSDFIPCSCGGVLEKLSWTQHLVFNLFFIILAGLAVFFSTQENIKKTLLLLTTLTIIGIATVALLFVFSEKKMHRNNAFQRRYPHHPVNEAKRLDLGYNSYYFAGIFHDSIYLGNSTAPIHLLSINSNGLDSTHHSLKIPNNNLPIRSLRTIVADSIFYTWDGSIPLFLKGETKNFTISVINTQGKPFLRTEYMFQDRFVVRTFDNITTKNVLGKLILKDSIAPSLYPEILTANTDPFFDTDGLLLYNEQLQKIIYVYFYRNEFVVVNSDFSIDYIGKTIDTISRAQLDIRTIAAKHERKIGQNPIFVNLRTATFGDYLFIQSDRLGKYESDEVLKSASIIDVYNLVEQTYAFSFYLYHQGLEKLHEFKVEGTQLFALIDNSLIKYIIKEENFKQKKINNKTI